MVLAASLAAAAAPKPPEPRHERLGTIINNDANNILVGGSGERATEEEYRRALAVLLDAKPGVLAQSVGAPDPVCYRSSVATEWDEHFEEVAAALALPKGELHAYRRLRALGTDPLRLAVEEGRRRGVRVLASYRMNADDFGEHQHKLSDAGREHPEWRIPNTPYFDPAIPAVYEHRIAIFREVLERYDVDGIELDFMRGTVMVSGAGENHGVLTRMVRDVRRLVDEAGRRRGRRMLLGARVPHALEGPGKHPDFSAKVLGLDVPLWLDEGLLDYISPSYYWPRLPGVPNLAPYVALAKRTRAGVYPTLFPLAAWMERNREGVPADNQPRRERYAKELAAAAATMFQWGADGISTYNWFPHHRRSILPNPLYPEWGDGAKLEQEAMLPLLDDPAALRAKAWAAGELPIKGRP